MSLKTVLIAVEDLDLAHRLRLQCERLALQAHCVPDAMHVLLDVRSVEPDLILLDVSVPTGNGSNVCQMLHSDSQLSSIPVIILTAQSEPEVQRRCQEMGAYFVSKGRDLWPRLGSSIRDILEIEPDSCDLDLPSEGPPVFETSTAAPTSVGSRTTNLRAEESPHQPHPDSCLRPKVLCIDDDPDISKAIKLRLEPLGIDVVRAFSGMQGFWSALDFKPHVVITDLNMPDGEGNYVMYRLQSHPLTKNVPVIILTGQVNPALRRQLLNQGADAYLTKPLVFDDLVKHLQKHIDVLPNTVPT